MEDLAVIAAQVGVYISLCYCSIDIWRAVTIFSRFSFYTTFMSASRFCFRGSRRAHLVQFQVTIETRLSSLIHGARIWIVDPFQCVYRALEPRVSSRARSAGYRISRRYISTLFRLPTARNFCTFLVVIRAAFLIYGASPAVARVSRVLCAIFSRRAASVRRKVERYGSRSVTGVSACAGL